MVQWVIQLAEEQIHRLPREGEVKPDRWRLVDGLYEAALEQPCGERAHFLEQQCENDPELLRAVRRL